MKYYTVVHYSTGHGWFDRQHFYQGLARSWAANRPQLYVSRPRPWPPGKPGAANATRIAGGYLHRVEASLWVLEPLITRGSRFRTVRRLRDRLVARATMSAIAQIALPRKELLIWAYGSDVLPLLKRLPAACSAYWTGDEVLDSGEPELLRQVDHVFAISPDAMTRARAAAGPKVAPMPMAVDPRPFISARNQASPPPEIAGLRRPLIGYGGAFSERIDWRLLDAVAAHTAGTLVLIGPVVNNHQQSEVELRRLEMLPNVVRLGHKSLHEAPKYIAALDVGLIPYTRSPFNDGSNPVKFYEYLAAGVPVVAVGLPALRALPVEGMALFEDDPGLFAQAVEALTRRRDSGEAVARRQEFATSHSFETLVTRIEDRIASGPCYT